MDTSWLNECLTLLRGGGAILNSDIAVVSGIKNFRGRIQNLGVLLVPLYNKCKMPENEGGGNETEIEAGSSAKNSLFAQTIPIDG